MQAYKKNWDDYWDKNNSWFGRVLELYRKMLIANSISYYTNKFFPDSGIFLEAGSGTSQTSIKIPKKNRKLIALDISKEALEKTRDIRNMDERVNADILCLPFKNSSLDGIWNHGVLEHFSQKRIQNILREFRRVLKPGSHAVLFWPPKHGSAQIALNPIEFALNLVMRRKFQLFPDEISKLSCRSEARYIIEKSGLEFVDVYFNHKDLFTNYAVVCRKPRNL
ncbi:MAG: class I SAM-dependent methyltransferase [Candidatus Aenigmarchaeota archaeon]|nr:class I SAM-dependent methyltransferase [Candidatus Aenigmarchaeota archaeon]